MELGNIIWWTAAVCIYFIPTIWAMLKGSTRRGDYFFFNVLIGWTIIGWLVLVSLLIDE